jgi:hypothetical protein
MGRNFFLVKFLRPSDRQAALSTGPWYMNRRPMHSFPWTPSFNIDTQFINEIPIWIELPFRDLILEPSRRRLIAELGPLLHYEHGRIHSEYPNDKALILWNIRRPVPKRLKLVYKNLIIWQEVEFKNLPTSCSLCRSTVHLAYQCPKLHPSFTPETFRTAIPTEQPRSQRNSVPSTPSTHRSPDRTAPASPNTSARSPNSQLLFGSPSNHTVPIAETQSRSSLTQPALKPSEKTLSNNTQPEGIPHLDLNDHTYRVTPNSTTASPNIVQTNTTTEHPSHDNYSPDPFPNYTIPHRTNNSTHTPATLSENTGHRHNYHQPTIPIPTDSPMHSTPASSHSIPEPAAQPSSPLTQTFLHNISTPAAPTSSIRISTRKALKLSSPQKHKRARLYKPRLTKDTLARLPISDSLFTFRKLLKYQHNSTTRIPNPYTPSVTDNSEYTSMGADDDPSASTSESSEAPPSTGPSLPDNLYEN